MLEGVGSGLAGGGLLYAQRPIRYVPVIVGDGPEIRTFGDLVLYVAIILLLGSVLLWAAWVIFRWAEWYDRRRAERAARSWSEWEDDARYDVGFRQSQDFYITSVTPGASYDATETVPANFREASAGTTIRSPDESPTGSEAPVRFRFPTKTIIRNTPNLTHLDADAVINSARETFAEFRARVEPDWIEHFPSEGRAFLEEVNALLRRTWADFPAALRDPDLSARFESEALGLRSLVYLNFPKVLATLLPHMEEKVATGEEVEIWSRLITIYKALLENPFRITDYDPDEFND